MNRKANISLLEKAIVASRLDISNAVVPTTALFESYVSQHKIISNKQNLDLGKNGWMYTYKLFVRDCVEYNKRNKNKSSVKFCYIITNPAWPGLMKIGIAEEPHKRLAQYQTYSPLRDYKLQHWSPHNEASEVEKLIISQFGNSALALGEWVSAKTIETLARKLNEISYEKIRYLHE